LRRDLGVASVPWYPPLSRAWQQFEGLAEETARFPLRQRFAFVNDSIAHADDDEQFGGDEWLTPLETLALGRGDCEDLAIAKYLLLLAAGSPPSVLRPARGLTTWLRSWAAWCRPDRLSPAACRPA
jgi:hypothetical protein